jgi:hypothetical protein
MSSLADRPGDRGLGPRWGLKSGRSPGPEERRGVGGRGSGRVTRRAVGAGQGRAQVKERAWLVLRGGLEALGHGRGSGSRWGRGGGRGLQVEYPRAGGVDRLAVRSQQDEQSGGVCLQVYEASLSVEALEVGEVGRRA